MSSEVEASIDAHLEMVGRRANAAYQVIKAAAEEATAIERARIVAALRKWADSMDAPEWRDGWTQEIVAAKSFALQIEDGSL